MHRLRLVVIIALAIACGCAARATIATALQMQLGNPSGATADATNHTHYLIQRAQYALDYNDYTNEPNWVAWDLTNADVGASGRSSFVTDTTLPGGFYQVKTTDYNGVGTYNPVLNRGHMCPSADRSITDADNLVVFYMSNILPQSADNNQGPWENFESYCRTLAAADNELLIVAGPSGFSGAYLPSGIAAIPGYTWKIAVVVPAGNGTAASRITSATRVIALKIPNIGGIRSVPWQTYVTSAAQIESDTGYTFFTALPAATASVLRLKVDGQSATAPTITTQPVAQTATVGGSASFTVSASGTAPLTYQWSKNTVAISGATAATLNLTTVQAADAGSYTVAVANAAGSVTSNAAPLTVNSAATPPAILTSPSALSVLVGTSATFSVSASGAAPLAYQWRKDGALIAGATAATFTIAGAQFADAGNYTVTVTNATGAVASSPASLIVTANAVAPSILAAPVTQAVSVGSPVNLSVVAAGTAPFTYQWSRNASAIAGATSATFTLAGAQLSDAGNYTVLVGNAAGTLVSAAAVLTVSATPLPPTITAQPASQAISAGTGATFTVTATGTAPLSYQWSKDGTPIAGATAATLALGNTPLSAAGNYAVLVTNAAGSATSNTATLTVGPALIAPAFTTQPTNRTADAGTTVTFTVAATGTAPITYGWFKDGAVIPGATSATLTLTDIDPASAGSYAAVATNAAGSLVSNSAMLAIATANPARLINLSILTQAGTDAQTLIVGFVVGGADTRGPKTLLLRGAGPSLAAFHVTDSLADPSIALYAADNTLLTYNDDWLGDPQVATAAARVGAFAFASTASKDAALFSNLVRSGYTVQITGADGATGRALAEIYDATPAADYTAITPRLINLSARAQVGAGTDVLTAGFVVGGNGTRTVLIRAIGPTLAVFGVTSVLADPRLDLFNGSAKIATNDNWSTPAASSVALGSPAAITTAATNVGAFALDPASRDAVLLLTLAPGSYTAQVSGADGGTGIALVEVYEVP